MEERASILPGLPRSGPTKSYWQLPPDEIADLRTTDTLPSNADVVIIGSGISGATIAYNLLDAQSDLKIVLLDARQACSGASGRNGGHTKHASYRTFPAHIEAAGVVDAVKIAQLEYDCMVAVHGFINEHNINADSRRVDTVDVFYDEQQWKDVHEHVKLMQMHMGKDTPVTDYRFYSKEEAASRFFTPNSYGAVRYEAGSLSAYKLTIGILKLALERGLNLQTNTPATGVEKCAEQGQTCWLVHTDRGTIRSSKLILATNGYTAHLLPQFQGVIVPFRGIVTAQRPGANLCQTGLATTYSFMYEKGYDYMITQPAGCVDEGDIVIGGGLTKGQGVDGINEYGNSDDTTVDADIEQYLTQATTAFFADNWGKDHPEGRVRHTWSGVMGYSADGYPFVGPVPGEEGLFLSASFQGHGMVLCFLCARAVTQMVLGHDKSDLDRWFPKCFRVSEQRMKIKFGGRQHINKATELEQTEEE